MLGLLQRSQAHNAQQGITGVLLYAHERFFQVLEGPRAAVTALTDRIAIDPRHTIMTVVLRESAEERLFGSWAMAS